MLLIWLGFAAASLAGCDATSTSPSAETVLTADVIDTEALLTEKEEAEMMGFLDSLEAVSGIDFVLCTVADPGPGGMVEYAAAMTRRISPGLPGLNNGAIIYLSESAREIKVEAGYGMEWYMSDTASGLVIETMRPLLVSGKYASAARAGFLEIASLAHEQSWKPTSFDWQVDSIAELEPGMILSLEGKGIARAYQEDVPESIQFHPNYFVNLLHDGRSSPLYFSGYMRDLVDRVVYAESPMKISCLVLNKEPFRLGLLGLTE